MFTSTSSSHPERTTYILLAFRQCMTTDFLFLSPQKENLYRLDDVSVIQRIKPSISPLADLTYKCFGDCVLSHFSHVQLFVNLQTVVCQASLCMGFSRQEYWNGWPCPPLGDLLNPVIEHVSHVSCFHRQVLYHQCHPGSISYSINEFQSFDICKFAFSS